MPLSKIPSLPPPVSDFLRSHGKSLAMEGAFLATLYFAAGRASRSLAPPVHPLVKERTDLAPFPGLASCLSVLASLEDARMSDLLDDACAFVRLSEQFAPASQSRMSRLIRSMKQKANAMVDSSDVGASDSLYKAALLCREDAIPQLESHLDDILHNHLLDRVGR